MALRINPAAIRTAFAEGRLSKKELENLAAPDSPKGYAALERLAKEGGIKGALPSRAQLGSTAQLTKFAAALLAEPPGDHGEVAVLQRARGSSLGFSVQENGTGPTDEQMKAVLAEVFGPKAVIEDKGKRGLDPADVVVFRDKKGKIAKTVELGASNFMQAKIQASIINAAKAFGAAQVAGNGVGFANKSGQDRVNQELWWMGYGGKMGVRQNVRPSDAINDVFAHGEKYACECATGTLLILYKGILDAIGPKDFDVAFAKTRLFRWEIKADAFKAAEREGNLPGFWPGDHTYFKNPEFDPALPQWQGENVIYLGQGMFFGHGVGTKTGPEIIDALNNIRKPGATQEAKRLKFELRLDGGEIAKLDRVKG